MMSRALLTVTAVAVSSGFAMAGFDAQFMGIHGVNNAIHIDNTGTGGSTNQTFNAGHFNFVYTDMGGQRGGGQFSGGSFSTFCIELQEIANGSNSYDVTQINNAPNPAPGEGGPQYDSADASEVNAVVAAAIRLGWLNADLSLAAATAHQLAAIQGQIWTVVLDDAVVTAANAGVGVQMAALQAEIANDPTARVHGLGAMVNAGSQDQLFIVPLPTAAFAGLMTLGGIAGFKRLRNR